MIGDDCTSGSMAQVLEQLLIQALGHLPCAIAMKGTLHRDSTGAIYSESVRRCSVAL